MKVKEFIHRYFFEIVVLALGLSFATFLMFSTFSKEGNNLLISTKAWSDFASHVPLIRSFSLGLNFPPQYPLFPGEPIKYHFLFYSGVGLLEKLGLPIDLALNIPSAIGFVFLIFIVYLSGKTIFKSKLVGLFSSIFLIFNSSLSYFIYFKNNPLSIESIKNIPAITNFQSFAPYDKGIVSAFWNLNIYTNQRHLAISFALSVAIIYFLIRPVFEKKKVDYRIAIVLGLILGLSFFLHMAVFLMTSASIFFLGIFFSKIRKNAFIILSITGLIALPQYLYLNSSSGFKMLFNPGYLLAGNLTFGKFWEFWIYNLGLSIILVPLGFIFADSKQRRILLSFVPLFVIGNLVQFSPEIAANHKFFNYFMIFANMFAAFALYIMWKKNNLLKPIVVILTFFMIFGGIIDFFPLYNDTRVSIADYEANPDARWVLENTQPNSIFLNTTYLYDPASLAGRKIFFGWPYFAWSQGYDTQKREEILREILGSTNKQNACKLLKENNIDFVEIKVQNPPDINIPPISNLFKDEFMPSYNNNFENYSIFSVNNNCK